MHLQSARPPLIKRKFFFHNMDLLPRPSVPGLMKSGERILFGRGRIEVDGTPRW